MSLQSLVDELDRRGGVRVEIDGLLYEIRLDLASLYGEEEAVISLNNLKLIAKSLEPDLNTCPNGTIGSCFSYRCGSNCDRTYDRMHPCHACTTVKMVEYRDVVRRVETLADRWERPFPNSDGTSRMFSYVLRTALSGSE